MLWKNIVGQGAFQLAVMFGLVQVSPCPITYKDKAFEPLEFDLFLFISMSGTVL